jgi:hypothetical protein
MRASPTRNPGRFANHHDGIKSALQSRKNREQIGGDLDSKFREFIDPDQAV